ncbi:tetratricopeptide repeat protein [Thermodesulfobacteriota bacterium]
MDVVDTADSRVEGRKSAEHPRVGHDAVSARWYVGLFLAFLVIAVAVLYAGFDSKMVYDGGYFVASQAELFKQHEVSKYIGLVPSRPLFMFTFYLNYLLGGMEPAYFRLANAAFLAGSGLMLTVLAIFIFDIPGLGVKGSERDKRWAAVLIGLLFVVHPLQTFVVLYVWQREAIMACLFYFGALAAYVGGRSGRFKSPNAAYVGAGLLLFGGLLSKENVVTLPVAMLLVDFTLFRESFRKLVRSGVRIAAICAPAALAYVLVTRVLHIESSVMRDGPLERLIVHYNYGGLSVFEVVFTQCRVFFAYVFMMVAPFLHDMPFVRPEVISRSLIDPPSTIFAVSGVLAIVGVGLASARKQPLLAFGLLFLVISLLPESLFIPQYLFFGYRAILPMAGLLLILAHTALALLERYEDAFPQRAFATGVAAVALIPIIGFAYLTYWHSKRWDPITFWMDAATRLPAYTGNVEMVPYLDIVGNCMAHLNIAKRYDDVIDLFGRVSGTPIKADARPAVEVKDVLDKAHKAFQPHAGRAAGVFASVGDALSDQGKLNEAVLAYRKAVESDPSNSVFHVGLGVRLEYSGILDEAVEMYVKAVELDPKSALAFNCLGNALKKQGKIYEAMEAFAGGVEADPKSVMSHSNLALIFLENGYIDYAIKHFSKAVELKPDSAQDHHNLGRAFAGNGDLEGSIKHYKKAVEINPKLPTVYTDLGLALEVAGEMPQAVQSHRKAVEIEPQSVQAWISLGSALEKAGDLSGAAGALAKAIETNPGAAPLHIAMARLLEESDRPMDALSYFRKAAKLDPANPEIQLSLGRVLEKADRPTEAMNHYRKAIELDHRLVAAYNRMSRALEKKGDLDAAIQYYRIARRIDEDHVETNYGLALALLKSGKFGESIGILRKVAEQEPERPEVQANLAVALLHGGKIPEAIVTLTKALALNKENADLCNALGLAFGKLNETRKATEFFEKALSLDPEHSRAKQNLERLMADKEGT